MANFTREGTGESVVALAPDAVQGYFCVSPTQKYGRHFNLVNVAELAEQVYQSGLV